VARSVCQLDLFVRVEHRVITAVPFSSRVMLAQIRAPWEVETAAMARHKSNAGIGPTPVPGNVIDPGFRHDRAAAVPPEAPASQYVA